MNISFISNGLDCLMPLYVHYAVVFCQNLPLGLWMNGEELLFHMHFYVCKSKSST